MLLKPYLYGPDLGSHQLSFTARSLAWQIIFFALKIPKCLYQHLTTSTTANDSLNKCRRGRPAHLFAAQQSADSDF